MTPDTQSPEIGTQLIEISTLVGAMRAQLDQGGSVDLTGLDSRVNLVCTQIDNLAGPNRKKFKAPLVALIDGLNGLTNDIATQHSALKKELADLSSRTTAATAYGQPAKK